MSDINITKRPVLTVEGSFRDGITIAADVESMMLGARQTGRCIIKLSPGQSRELYRLLKMRADRELFLRAEPIPIALTEAIFEDQ